MFKDIPGYEGIYQINECGVVINLKHEDRIKLVRLFLFSASGYLGVSLYKYGRGSKENKLVHRLVASTFLPNPDDLPVVMHLDNDKLNNHTSNLKWGTTAENIQQAVREGRKGGPRNHYQVYNNDNSDVVTGFGYSGIAEII